jgi:hypothetical protein
LVKLYLILLAISCFLYFIFYKFSQWQRILIVLLSFFISATIITFLLVYIGDKPTPGARDVTKEILNKEGK